MDQIAAKRAKVVVENNNNNGDLISSLPDAILQKIMSLLPPKHATATSILSRRWEAIWLSFPVIDLDQSDFTNRRKFNFCLKSTSSSHNLSDLKTLRLRVNLPSSTRLNRRVCKFMNVVLRDGKILEELNIQFANPLLYRHQDMGLPSQMICTLPNETFSSCSHLIFLKVEGCRFEGCPRVDLPELKTLHMKNVFIHEEFLVELVHACPVVETLSVEFCFGIVNVRIVHSKLQYLVLGFRNNLETLELDMPDVKCINFNALVNSVTEEGLINVLGYQNSRKVQARNLETLRLECLILKPDVLHNLISIFPKMEKLDMTECVLSGQVELNSKSLTSLGMTECVLLGEVDIKACNLREVGYLHNPEGFQLNYNIMKYVRRLSLFNLEEVEFGTLWIKGSIFRFLVSLELIFCSSMKQFKIVSNTLESLEVLWCEHLKNCHIVAPKLSTFSFSGQVVHMIHLDTSKELHVTLHLEGPDRDHDHVGFVKRFVGFLQNVGASAASMVIELGFSCTECLMMIKAIDLPPTSLVQHVKFDTWMEIDAIGLRDLLSSLLGISMYCNNLSINLGWFSVTLQFEEIKKKKACVGKTELGRIEDHLVRVEMKSFTGSDEQVDLAGFFVRKARHMQKMTIWMKKGEEEDATQKCLDAFHRKLRIFQRFDIVSHGDCVSFSRNAI